MDKEKTILITGTNGLVGFQAYEFLSTHTPWNIIGTSRSSGKHVDHMVDLTDYAALKEFSLHIHPDILIHTAAISRTDECDKNRAVCYATNVGSTDNLVTLFPNAKIIYFSTYAVYNTSEGMCDEECDTIATNYYIETKLEAESYVKFHKNYVILRPSVIFGYVDYQQASKNYFMQLLDNIKGKKLTKSPKDQFINPISVDVVVEVLFRMIDTHVTGVYNLGSNENISKFEFNRAVIDRFLLDPSLLEGISSASLDVKRPSMGTIKSVRIQNALEFSIPSLQVMIDNLYHRSGDRVSHYISGSV